MWRIEKFQLIFVIANEISSICSDAVIKQLCNDNVIIGSMRLSSIALVNRFSFFHFLQRKSYFSTWFSMPSLPDSSPLCWLCFIKLSTPANPSGNLTMAWLDRTLDLGSDQCPQSRMLRAHSCGSRPQTRRTQNTGLEL